MSEEKAQLVCSAEVPLTNPMRATWEAYKLTDDYANTRSWALFDKHVDGSLWAAYCAGWKAAKTEITSVVLG